MSSIKEYLFYILDFLSHIEDIICIKMMEHILFIIIINILQVCWITCFY